YVKQRRKLTPCQRPKLTPLRPVVELHNEAVLLSCFKAKTFVSSFENIAVMGNSIEHGCCHFGIHKNVYPFPKTQIGRDDNGYSFIQLAYQMKQQGPTCL